MAKTRRQLLQADCLNFYYRESRRRFYNVRSGLPMVSDARLDMPAATCEKILATADGSFNPLWAIRMITDEAIHYNRDLSGRLNTITYKRAAEYASYGMDWAKQQREIADSSCHVLKERVAMRCSSFAISLGSGLRMIKEEAELDPVVELAYRCHHEIDVDEVLRNWAGVCYSFFPPIYSQLSAEWRKSQKLYDLFRVPDGYSVIDRPAAISGLFSTESTAT